MQSHPSWVCGLKPERSKATIRQPLSHPSWVCGLKLGNLCQRFHNPRVTPFVGVWIETQFKRLNYCPFSVTPFVGVWIET